MTAMEHHDSPRSAASAPLPSRASEIVRSLSEKWVLAGTIIATVGIDQLTKAVAVDALRSGPAHVGILHLRLVANRGLLMGMLEAPVVIVGGATLLVVVIAIRAERGSSRVISIGYGLLAGGALGNLVDRLLQRQQFPPNAVVDWVSFGGVTFNLADAALLIGTVMFLAAHQAAPDEPAS